MIDEPEVWVLVLTDAGTIEAPMGRRVAKLLKHALRSLGLRCVEVRKTMPVVVEVKPKRKQVTTHDSIREPAGEKILDASLAVPVVGDVGVVAGRGAGSGTVLAGRLAARLPGRALEQVLGHEQETFLCDLREGEHDTDGEPEATEDDLVH